MLDKHSANYKEGTIRDAIAAFRKQLVIEYATRNRFELLDHIKENDPNTKSGDFVVIATIRQQVAFAALEKLLWDARSD